MDVYDKKWANRKKNNQAEGIFEKFLDHKGIEYVKCGIDAIERNLPGAFYLMKRAIQELLQYYYNCQVF